uniref:Peptidase S1 domain-containing protein n=1 Tax=Heterorhabditis bacteriophora TaxID=37862 RepID=A0A1I7XQX0_HETBA
MSSGAVDFTPYRPSEQYKCGAFLQGRVEDKTLEYYYQGINTFVSWISNPFPHQDETVIACGQNDFS